MGLELGCPPRQVAPFLRTEERKVEKFLALNLSQIKFKYNELELFYSSKNFRLFFKPMNKNSLLISISKKNFRRAVDRNRLKRRIREVFRASSFCDRAGGMIVFSVFKPFGGLSYSKALLEVGSAIELFVNRKNKK